MKAIATFCVLVLLDAACLVFAQVYYANGVGRGEALKAASHLKVGMGEEDASVLLRRYGLTNNIGVGAMTGWNRSYGLTDGSALVLDYSAQHYVTSHWWEGHGVLQRAFIQSNGITVSSIPLTNAP